jgi:soluble lytic murein transglycosylase-like protein
MQQSFVTRAVLFLFSTICLSQAVHASGDTTSKSLRMPVAKKTEEPATATKAANVVFPALLEDAAEESLEYIEKFSVNRRAYLERTYAKSKKFFPKAQAILKKYDVPSEFVVLLALESAFNGNAVSRAGAVGYWQIMDDVAKEYGLKIVEDQHIKKKPVVAKKGKTAAPVAKKKPAVDDRKNFNVSTHTAAKYLKARMRNLDNNWLLIAASYNWGVGNVWNAIERSGKKNPTFWDIKDQLPAETKAYVMNFITLNVIFNNYEKFASNSLFLPEEKDPQDLPKAEKDAAVSTL